MDREEFFRLKKVQSKKKRDNAARELEQQSKRKAAEDHSYDDESGRAKNLLNAKDEDVIF
jgi:V-type H+-transporting ATPase subunit D